MVVVLRYQVDERIHEEEEERERALAKEIEPTNE